MMIDTSLAFSSWSTPVAITATKDSSLVDITGAGLGVAPAMINGPGAANTAIGVDIGQGDGIAIPYLVMIVTTAFVSAGGATLTVTLNAAPDSGTYTAGSYTTIYTSIAFTAAQLVAGQALVVQVPPRVLSGVPGEALPRFYKLTYTVATSTFSAGAVSAGILLNPPAFLVNTLYNSNFTVV